MTKVWVAGTHRHGPALYRIRVSGRMGPEWSDRLQGMTVSPVKEEGREARTDLSGRLADQTALMGVLQYLDNCRISVLSVECISEEPCKE